MFQSSVRTWLGKIELVSVGDPDDLILKLKDYWRVSLAWLFLLMPSLSTRPGLWIDLKIRMIVTQERGEERLINSIYTRGRWIFDTWWVASHDSHDSHDSQHPAEYFVQQDIYLSSFDAHLGIFEVYDLAGSYSSISRSRGEIHM